MRILTGSFVILSVLVVSFGAAPCRAEEASADWAAASPADLAVEYRRLKSLGPLETYNRQRLMRHTESRYLSAAGAADFDVREWLDVAAAMGAEFPAKLRQAMSARIRSDFVPDKAAADQIYKTCLALRSLGASPPDVAAVASAWITASDKHRTAPPGTIALLAVETRAAGEDGDAARKRLFELIHSRFMADANAVRATGLGYWGPMVTGLRDIVSAESRKAWSDKLYGAYVADKEALAALAFEDVRQLKAVLGALSPADAARAFPAWVTDTDAWTAMGCGELAELGREVAGSGKPGEAAMRRLVGHVDTERLADAKAIRAVPPPLWAPLFRSLAIPDERRAAMAGKLFAAYASDAAELSKLGIEDCQHLADALRQLKSGRADAVVPAWVEKTEAWHQVAPAALVQTAQELARSGKTGEAAMARLVRRVETQYLDGMKLTAPTASQFYDLVGQLPLTAEERAKLCEKLFGLVLSDPATLAKFTYADCDRLSVVLRHYGSERSTEVFTRWVEKTKAWQKLGPMMLSNLAGGQLSRGGEAGARAQGLVGAYVEKKYLADAKTIRSLRPSVWRQLILSICATPEARAAWSEKVYAAYAADIASQKFPDCAELARELEMLGSPHAKDVLVVWVEKTDAWRKLGLMQIAEIGRAVGRAGESGDGAMKRLVRHVETGSLATPDAIRAVSVHRWNDLISSLKLSAERRAAWAEKLFAAYTSDAAQLRKLGLDAIPILAKSLKVSDAVRAAWGEKVFAAYTSDAAELGKLGLDAVRQVSSVLASMKSNRSAEVFPAWVAGTDSWKSLSANDLVFVAVELGKSGERGEAARKLLLPHVEAKFLADAKSARSVHPSLWVHFGRTLGLSDEERPRFAAKVRAAFESDMSSITFGDCEMLERTARALGAEKPGGVFVAWVEKTDAWQELPPYRLITTARHAAAAGEVGHAALARMARHAGTKWFGDAETIRSLDLNAIPTLVKSLKVSDAVRAAWSEKVFAAYTSDAAELAKLGLSAVRQVSSVLASMKSNRSAEMFPAWVAGTDSWKSLSANDLAFVAGELGKSGERGEAARKLLLAHVEVKFLADAKSARSVPPHLWVEFGRTLGSSAEERLRFAARVRTAFESDVSSMTFADCEMLERTARALGVKDPGEVFVTWVEKTDAWHSLDVNGLRHLSNSLARSGDAASGALKRLREYVGTKRLADAKTVRSVRPRGWAALIAALAEDDETRAAWSEKMFDGFAAGAASLTLGDCAELKESLKGLGMPKKSLDVFPMWVQKTDAWTSLSPGELGRIGEELSASGDAGRAAMRRLVKHVETKYLKDNVAIVSAGCRGWSAITTRIAGSLTEQERTAWAGKLRVAFVDDKAVIKKLAGSDIVALSTALKELGDTDAKSIVAKWMAAK